MKCLSMTVFFLSLHGIVISKSAFNKRYLQTNQPWETLPSKRSSKLATPFKRSSHMVADGQPYLEEINECLKVSKDTEGYFFYEHVLGEEVCGLYLVGRPDQRVKITLENADIGPDCDEEVIVLLDGWELNGNILPSVDDHQLPLDKRFVEFCGSQRKKIQIISTQNNAMVQYKIKKPGQRFLVFVEYIPNPDPCNILMSDLTGVFTFASTTWARNCSLTTLMFPAKFEVLDLSIGAKVSKRKDDRHTEVGISSKCSHSGERDYLELGGSSYLSSSRLGTREAICGYEPEPLTKAMIILCDSSTVRLVSSGDYKNHVTVLVRAAGEDDLENKNDVKMVCPNF